MTKIKKNSSIVLYGIGFLIWIPSESYLLHLFGYEAGRRQVSLL